MIKMKVGDVVQLKSGGSSMTIVSVDGDEITVNYWGSSGGLGMMGMMGASSSDIQTRVFSSACLTVCEKIA